MDPATPILLVGRSLALSSFSCLGTASLARPISPKTSFNTYGGIIFGLQPKDPDVSVYYTAYLLHPEELDLLIKFQVTGAPQPPLLAL